MTSCKWNSAVLCEDFSCASRVKVLRLKQLDESSQVKHGLSKGWSVGQIIPTKHPVKTEECYLCWGPQMNIMENTVSQLFFAALKKCLWFSKLRLFFWLMTTPQTFTMEKQDEPSQSRSSKFRDFLHKIANYQRSTHLVLILK